MTFNDIKSHKKLELHPLYRKYVFGKTQGRGQYDPTSYLRVKK